MPAAAHARAENTGFAGQRVCVVPLPQVATALRRPATRQLTVVHAGYYRRAAGHTRERGKGTRDVIVILCIAGTGTVEVGGTSHPVGPLSYAVLPAFTPHTYRASADNPWTIWWVHLRGTGLGDLTRVLMRDGRPVTRVRSVGHAVALFDELLTLLERRLSPAHILASSGVAWQLLTRLAADGALPSEDSPLDRAIRYLEARVDGTVRVDDLAALVGLSTSHLTAQFRKATGGGPGAFHTGLKMARARTLLDTTTKTIGEIARAVGYTDALYFSRQFRRHHGISPSSYRAQAKG
ncbi:AraC family transcriptional regulator [Allonocardiopsis opalescens]|uniref:AraC family transcriptional regulator n=1 Tax=Allonocardiopsis opalescens TaxID=1144618 RepID=A0A2T0QF80_9ACTN|nr:AraC family transcriptional regulator [Allonocardiopsis opalescens]PRY02572.1 AraC family transcriptional regulator [Allonocardiopsis opalescens]